MWISYSKMCCIFSSRSAWRRRHSIPRLTLRWRRHWWQHRYPPCTAMTAWRREEWGPTKPTTPRQPWDNCQSTPDRTPWVSKLPFTIFMQPFMYKMYHKTSWLLLVSLPHCHLVHPWPSFLVGVVKVQMTLILLCISLYLAVIINLIKESLKWRSGGEWAALTVSVIPRSSIMP